MGYIFDFKDSQSYNEWVNHGRDPKYARLETDLILNMLKPQRGDRHLDIGCGTGTLLSSLLEMGIDVTGLDASPYMLDIARELLGNRADFHRGFSEDLPFDDNEFNSVSLVTTLEFVDDPLKTLEEAFRVAKDRVFIGALNRYAIKGVQRRVRGVFSKTIFNRARFFSIWELKDMVNDIIGEVPVSWRTVCQFPSSTGKIAYSIEKSKLTQRLPFGTFVGMVVTPVPKFRTRPLSLKYGSSLKSTPEAGLTGVLRGDN